MAAGGPAPAGAAEPPDTAFGAPNPPSPRTTPDAGTAVAQPAAQLRRYDRATFAWQGGDPSIDAPDGSTFVALQRRVGDAWQTEATDDGPADTTVHAGDGTWTETFQLGACTRAGTYRFAVTGRADKGDGPAPYAVTSQPFEVRPLTLVAGPVQLAGGVARVTLRYPDP